MFSSMIHFHPQSHTTTKHWISLQFKYLIEFENESCLETLEIRSNYLEDRFDLEIEFTFKTMEIRSKVQIFSPTPNPTLPPNIGPYFNSDIKSIS